MGIQTKLEFDANSDYFPLPSVPPGCSAQGVLPCQGFSLIGNLSSFIGYCEPMQVADFQLAATWQAILEKTARSEDFVEPKRGRPSALFFQNIVKSMDPRWTATSRGFTR